MTFDGQSNARRTSLEPRSCNHHIRSINLHFTYLLTSHRTLGCNRRRTGSCRVKWSFDVNSAGRYREAEVDWEEAGEKVDRGMAARQRSAEEVDVSATPSWRRVARRPPAARPSAPSNWPRRISCRRRRTAGQCTGGMQFYDAAGNSWPSW